MKLILWKSFNNFSKSSFEDFSGKTKDPTAIFQGFFFGNLFKGASDNFFNIPSNFYFRNSFGFFFLFFGISLAVFWASLKKFIYKIRREVLWKLSFFKNFGNYQFFKNSPIHFFKNSSNTKFSKNFQWQFYFFLWISTTFYSGGSRLSSKAFASILFSINLHEFSDNCFRNCTTTPSRAPFTVYLRIAPVISFGTHSTFFPGTPMKAPA